MESIKYEIKLKCNRNWRKVNGKMCEKKNNNKKTVGIMISIIAFSI